MNILYISIGMPLLDGCEGGFYADLVRSMWREGNNITVITPSHNDGFEGLRKEGNFQVLRVEQKPFVGDIPLQKKGIRILKMSSKYKKAYKKHLWNQNFDIVIMATPPATLVDVVSLVKKHTGAKFYLILRDIHPECLNRRNVPHYVKKRDDVYDECKKPYGVNKLIEKLLYIKSQRLYGLADWVGCMSPGNQDYYKKIAPLKVNQQIVLLPNWFSDEIISNYNSDELRAKYGLEGKFIAIFGGTIGAAQAIWNIATLAKHNLGKEDVVFLIVGRGEKKKVLEKMAIDDNLTNMRFLEYMPKDDYDRILHLADVGLISIDEKYKVPTCPSKIIGYMALSKPVLAMFNEGNDYGEFYIDRPNCGLWSTSLDNEKMFENFDLLYSNGELRSQMGQNGFNYFREHFTAEKIGSLLLEQISDDYDV